MIAVDKLTGAALDWAMATALSIPVVAKDGETHDETLVDMGCDGDTRYNPSTNWVLGGPILERLRVDIKAPRPVWGKFSAYVPMFSTGPMEEVCVSYGSSMLEAGIKTCVKYVMGDEVEIPEEILK